MPDVRRLWDITVSVSSRRSRTSQDCLRRPFPTWNPEKSGEFPTALQTRHEGVSVNRSNFPEGGGPDTPGRYYRSLAPLRPVRGAQLLPAGTSPEPRPVRGSQADRRRLADLVSAAQWEAVPEVGNKVDFGSKSRMPAAATCPRISWVVKGRSRWTAITWTTRGESCSPTSWYPCIQVTAKSKTSRLLLCLRRAVSARSPIPGGCLVLLRGYEHLDRGRWRVDRTVPVCVDALEGAASSVPYTTLFFVSLVLRSVRVSSSISSPPSVT